MTDSLTKILHSAFALLLAASLCGPAHVTAGSNLPVSADAIKPLGTGDLAPSFSVQTVEGEAFEFDSSAVGKPVVFIAYRGGWCPYCNMQLSELRHVIPEIRELGFDVYFISNDQPEALYSSLDDEAREYADSAGYTILSDSDLRAARAFGTAFRTPDAMLRMVESRNPNRDLSGSSMERHQALAVPSVYAIDTDGSIAFSYVNANYTERMDPSQLLEAAKSVAAM